MDDFGAIAGHYSNLLIQYAFAAVITAVIVMLIHRAFQRFLLSVLDEVRDSTVLYKELLHKKSKSDSDRATIGLLTLAYAVLSGLVFIGIMMLLSDLATPVG